MAFFFSGVEFPGGREPIEIAEICLGTGIDDDGNPTNVQASMILELHDVPEPFGLLDADGKVIDVIAAVCPKTHMMGFPGKPPRIARKHDLLVFARDRGRDGRLMLVTILSGTCDCCGEETNVIISFPDSEESK